MDSSMACRIGFHDLNSFLFYVTLYSSVASVVFIGDPPVQ